MKSNKHSVYQLALLTSLFFPAEKVRDIAEDYTEYLREQPEKPDSPWQFCTAIMREERRYHPKNKTFLVILVTGFLLFLSLKTRDFVPLSFLAVALPAAIWTAISGNTAARYSPGSPHAARCVLLPFLTIMLLSAGFFLFINAVVTKPFQVTRVMAWIIINGRWACSAASMLLFLASAFLLWRSSIWYFCPLIQSVSSWCFFRGIYYILTSMDVSVSPPFVQHFYCLIPLALGLSGSLIFALILRNITGKEDEQWMDK